MTYVVNTIASLDFKFLGILGKDGAKVDARNDAHATPRELLGKRRVAQRRPRFELDPPAVQVGFSITWGQQSQRSAEENVQ